MTETILLIGIWILEFLVSFGHWKLDINWNLGIGIWNFHLIFGHCFEIRISDFYSVLISYPFGERKSRDAPESGKL